MICRVEVFGSVPIRRRVAAANMPATEAQSEVHPAGAGFQTFLASVGGARPDISDLVHMPAGDHARLRPVALRASRAWALRLTLVLAPVLAALSSWLHCSAQREISPIAASRARPLAVSS